MYPAPKELFCKNAKPVSMMNNVLNIIISRLNGCNVKFQSQMEWIAWHGLHGMEIIFSPT